ncbi:MAG: hypothetical protein MJE77_43085 [Proteobacteria bacterium]|nr:hypothetical protein [Pseudomonadota bacterium]
MTEGGIDACQGRRGRSDNPLTAGIPQWVSIDGELVAGDETDLDYPDQIYYINYFDIADLTHEKAIILQVTSNDLERYVGLYDRDQRDANGSGDLLQYFVAQPGEVVKTAFSTTPEVNYVIGVSTLLPQNVGAYSVTVVNDGDLVPTSFDSEMAPFSRLAIAGCSAPAAADGERWRGLVLYAAVSFGPYKKGELSYAADLWSCSNDHVFGGYDSKVLQ